MNTPLPAPNPGNQPPAPVPAPAPPSPQPQAGGGRGGNAGGGGPRPPQLQQPPAPQGQVHLSDADVNRIADRLRATIPPTQPPAQTPPDRNSTSNTRQSPGFTFSDLLKWILMILLILVAVKFLWSWDFSPRAEGAPNAPSVPQAQTVPENPSVGVNPGTASVEDPIDGGKIDNTRHVGRNVEPPQVKALLDSGIHAVLVRSTNKVWSRRPGPYGKGQVTAVP